MKLIYTGDFERLKEFGMFHNPSSEVWLADKDDQSLIIDENDREIELETVQIGFGNYKLEKAINDKSLSILYDLISAGLVKKVEEKQIETKSKRL